MDVHRRAAGSPHVQTIDRPFVLGVLAVGDDGVFRVLAFKVDPEFVVGNGDHLLVHPALYEDPCDGDVAVVRAGIDSFLDGHVVTEAVLVHHNVVIHKMFRKFWELLPDRVANQEGNFPRSIGLCVGVVDLSVRSDGIFPGLQAHEIRF